MMSVGMGAHAEEKRGVLEEVVVTAQKRQEKLQDVPIAITAVTSEELQTKGITDFPAVLREMPTIYAVPFLGGSTGSLNVSMRGLGSALGGNADSIDIEGSVGLYLDGFYLARSQAMAFDLADVERVEVLRGPQGTLYGRNTTGGAINLISKKPTGEFGFKQNLTFGSRNEFRALTAINLPAWHEVATKFTVLKSSLDGYAKNPGASHDFGEDGKRAGRFDLRWTPLQEFSLDYFWQTGRGESSPLLTQSASLAGSPITFGTSSYIYPAANRPLRIAPRAFDLPLSKSSSTMNGLTLTWNVNDALTVKSLTSYFTLTTNGFFDYADVAGFPVSEPRELHDHQFSQEVQFIGNAFEHRINYVAGVYHSSEKSSLEDTVNVDVGLGAPFAAVDIFQPASGKSTAGYAQITWTPPVMDDRLDLVLGGRYTRDTREGSTTDVLAGITTTPYHQKGNKFTPSYTINYRWTEDVSTYGKVAIGYKSGGGLGGIGTTGSGNQVFRPETLTSYELGLKSYWLDHRVRLNLAGFIGKYKDQQTPLVLPDPNNFNIATQQANNIGKVTIKGLEVELLAQPLEDLLLSLNYSRVYAHIDAYPAIAGSIFDGGSPAGIAAGSPYSAGDYIGREFVASASPPHSLSASGDYTFLRSDRGTLSAHLDYRYQSRYAQAGPAIPGQEFTTLPSYGIFNGRLSWSFDPPRGGHATVGLWGRNLTNKEYVAQIGGNPSSGSGLSFAPPGGVPGYTQSFQTWAIPRSYGADISYQFD